MSKTYDKMEVMFSFFFFTLFIGATVLWIWCIIDIIRSEFRRDNDRILWLLLVLLVPVIGTILYIIMGRDLKEEDFPDEL